MLNHIKNKTICKRRNLTSDHNLSQKWTKRYTYYTVEAHSILVFFSFLFIQRIYYLSSAITLINKWVMREIENLNPSWRKKIITILGSKELREFAAVRIIIYQGLSFFLHLRSHHFLSLFFFFFFFVLYSVAS